MNKWKWLDAKMPRDAQKLTLLDILKQNGVEVLPGLSDELLGPLEDSVAFAGTIGHALANRRLGSVLPAGTTLTTQPGSGLEEAYMAGLRGERKPPYLRPQPRYINVATDTSLAMYRLGRLDSKLYRESHT